MEEMIAEIKQKQAEIKRLQKELQDKSSEIFLSSFKNLFEETPKLKSFAWSQYTPYFNDGETCEFSANVDYIQMNGEPVDESEWISETFKSLNDRKIGIIGFGSIGATIAKMLAGFAVEVVGFTQSGRDNTIAITDLDKHLPSLDVVILILPLTKESKHLFDARRLALMKDAALLVIVARGPVVETGALIKELNSGRISAALDVTDPEPLPKDHPLWKAKGVLISPHVGGNTTAFERRARSLIESQLDLLANNKTLNNIIVAGN